MHERLTVEVTPRRFTAWRLAVLALALLAAANMVAWTLQRPEALPALRLAGIVLGVLVPAFLAGSLAAVRSGTLRYDGERWTFRADPGAGSESPAAPPAAIEIELEVALDLGSFLLLRLTPMAEPRRAGVRWLPVQRRGLETAWQPLRCAVHAPRRAAATELPVAASHPLQE